MAYLKTGHFICSCFKEECNKDCPSYKKFTHKKNNADRIRAMSDEELAEWILSVQQDLVSYYACEKHVPELPVERHTWLDWLKQEVNE